MKNETLIKKGRHLLTSLLNQCTIGHHKVFIKMYGQKGDTLDDCIKNMDADKIDWAITQIENTLKNGR